MNESELIAAAKNGDVDSFNRLVLEYQDMAYSVAYRIVGDADIAADATQNAVISAYRKLHQFKGEYFKAWLMRIVTNACYDELRRLKRRPVASLDKIEEESDGFDYGDPGESPMMGDVEMPEQAMQQQELQAAIEDCIQALGETHRGVVVFTDVEGYSYEETAEILDISLGTVKSRLSRARARLRDCLQEKGELLPAQYRL
jgi:RNA polymerase sigma-70 factor (ECF subfamily)